MKRAMRLPEDELNAWLDEGTYGDWLYLAQQCRKRLEKALDDERVADNQVLCRELYAQYQRVFTPVLPW